NQDEASAFWMPLIPRSNASPRSNAPALERKAYTLRVMIPLPHFNQLHFYAERFTLGLRRRAS
ncbi:MAG TPA: hypothetical protein VMV80_05585, partial [Anaerolineales bacterium]|nr:hypothetical protein [Anaerolineales bacterium]